MGFKLAEAFVDIVANDKQFNASLAATRSRLSAFVESMNQFAIPVAGVAGVAAIGQGLMKSIKSAGDLNESLSKVDVVFGDASGSVQEFAEKMRQEFGSTQTAILDAAAGIGLIGKAAGQSQAQAGEMAVQLAKLADDASSFYNVSLEDALLTIRSALVGESEPIRKFGVLLNEAAVQSEALSLGLAKSKDQISEAAKVAARYSLIVKGMKDASGDHARTQDSFNNQLREFEGRITSLGTSLGQTLIPVANALLSALNPVVEKLGQISDAIAKIPGAAEELTSALGPQALPEKLTRFTGFERARGAAGPDPAAVEQEKAAKDLQVAAADIVDKEEKRVQLAAAADAERLRRQEAADAKRQEAQLVEFVKNIGESDMITPWNTVNPLVREDMAALKEEIAQGAQATLQQLGAFGNAMLQMQVQKVNGLIDLGGAVAQGVVRNRADDRVRGSLGVAGSDSFQQEAMNAAANRRGNQEEQLQKLKETVTVLTEIQQFITGAKLKLSAPFGGN